MLPLEQVAYFMPECQSFFWGRELNFSNFTGLVWSGTVACFAPESVAYFGPEYLAYFTPE